MYIAQYIRRAANIWYIVLMYGVGRWSNRSLIQNIVVLYGEWNMENIENLCSNVSKTFRLRVGIEKRVRRWTRFSLSNFLGVIYCDGMVTAHRYGMHCRQIKMDLLIAPKVESTRCKWITCKEPRDDVSVWLRLARKSVTKVFLVKYLLQ